MGKSLADLTAEIRDINVSKGWRPAEGGPGGNTFGDYIALLHSEVSEALEAYRDWRLVDVTRSCDRATPDSPCDICPRPKPEGVGSELADVLIRLLDMCDVFGLTPFEMDLDLTDVEPAAADRTRHLVSFGDWMTDLHKVITQFGDTTTKRTREILLPFVLRQLVATAEHHGIDLTAEVARKVTYNRTRAFQHGGRTLAGER